jgi:general secretion pathway protein A
MTVAGGERAATLFTRPALQLVHRFAGGVPRLVNMIGHRSLLAAYVVRQRRVTARIVRRANREIRTVPLTAPQRSWSLRWAAPVAALGLGLVMLDIPHGGRQQPVTVSDVVDRAPAVEAAVASNAPIMPEPPAPPTAPPADAAADVAAFEQRIGQLSPAKSLWDALDAVFAAWQAPVTKPGEATPLDSLDILAHRRGLEDLHLTSNLSMLRLLDLPAVLELRSSDTAQPVYAALIGIDDDSVTLRVGGETLDVSPIVLDPVWFGDAHVFWRDFEWLGPTFGRETSGVHVIRLQELLTHAGLFSGPATGKFGDETAAAVVDFQRSRRLDPDCRIGRLTRIALYNAAGSYPMPTLAKRAQS